MGQEGEKMEDGRTMLEESLLCCKRGRGRLQVAGDQFWEGGAKGDKEELKNERQVGTTTQTMFEQGPFCSKT